jgi:hypothetical protein
MLKVYKCNLFLINKNTVEPGCNDIGLHDTLSMASDIL